MELLCGKQPTALTCRKLHHRLPTGFQVRIWLEVLWMWDVGGLQVHGIRSHRLVYKEIVDVRPNYKKPYFWWFGNPACGDSTGSDRIEKYQASVSGRLNWGKRGEGVVWFSVCGAPSMIGLMVVMLMSYSRVVSVVCVLWGAGAILRNGYGI